MSKLLIRSFYLGLCVLGGATNARATILTIDSGTGTTNTTIPNTFGDNVAAAATGISVANGATPNIGLTWSAQVNTAFTGNASQRWEFYNDGEWKAAQLNNFYEAFAHNLTFAPDAGFGVLVDSFVVDDYAAYKGGNQLLWELRQDSVGGALISGGTANTTNGENLLVNTGMASAYAGTVVLRLIGGDDPDDTVFGNANRANAGYQGADDIAIDSISFQQVAVPEPTGCVLIAMSLLGIGIRARSRQR